MALRNQPYLPLYVQDFLTDEKLIECSAEATGVYIRLMCILHKSEEYGQLKLSDRYNDKDAIKNYADMLSKQMPYSYEIIYRSLEELLREKVVFFAKNMLTQKRMFNDNIISKKRAKAGSIGGKHSKQNVSKKQAKVQANTEYEYEYNNIYNTYGIYNRIRLTNIQYNKLIEDYNKELIDKQIILLDEYIQSNNNKQKYTDFNLVLRKSIRENWFKDKVADKLPHWVGKKIEKQEMSKEEEEELKKGL